MILATKEMQKEKEDKDVAAVCFEKIELEQEKFRLGHTKVTNLFRLTECLADSARSIPHTSQSLFQSWHAQLQSRCRPFRERSCLMNNLMFISNFVYMYSFVSNLC